ncbi:hypothetical protein ACGF0D_23840 [Kitasatospora sp. NPDC048298]|uniref:hypothetical protein n=1 Tax=Kitasatospora sp. NPDC048298 TaxID=3364049 RepID=UPI00371872F9
MGQRVGQAQGEAFDAGGEAGRGGEGVGPVGEDGGAVDLGEVEAAQGGQGAAGGDGAVHGGDQVEAAGQVGGEGEGVVRVADACGVAAQVVGVGVAGAEHGERDGPGLGGGRLAVGPVAEDPGASAGVVQGTVVDRAPHRGHRGSGFGVRQDDEPGPPVTAHGPVLRG